MNRRELIKIMGSAAMSLGMPKLSWAAAKSNSLYENAIVIDGNLAAPWDDEKPLDPAAKAEFRASGLTAFKQTLGGPGNRTKAQTDEEVAELQAVIKRDADLLFQVTKAADFASAKQAGKIGVIFSFEAGEMLEGQIDAIDHFRAQGVLVMGLSYNRQTPFASGTMVPSSAATGLTPLGREAVQRMNAQGVTIDVSHSDEQSSFGALEASAKPLLITHAGCAAVHPHPRNKSDALLKALADKGGVVGIYELSYLTSPPDRQPKLEDYLAHLTHALDVCGEDHVGIGSDSQLTRFVVTPESLKAWKETNAARKAAGVAAPGEGPLPFVIGLNRSDRCRVIAEALHKKGYGDRIIEKVLGSNFQRVFNETWHS
jgi:membrane dipeptidase